MKKIVAMLIVLGSVASTTVPAAADCAPGWARGFLAPTGSSQCPPPK
jgi:hypothetical protein